MASSPHTYPPATQVPVRKLNLHEAQSANIMRDHGVNTPKGGVAKTPEEAYKVHIYTVLCMCLSVKMGIYIYIHVSACACVNIYVYIHTNICMHTRTHTLTHTHTHTYMTDCKGARLEQHGH